MWWEGKDSCHVCMILPTFQSSGDQEWTHIAGLLVLYSRIGNTNFTQWKKMVYNDKYKIVVGSYIAYYFTLQGRNSRKSPSFIDLEGLLPYRE